MPECFRTCSSHRWWQAGGGFRRIRRWKSASGACIRALRARTIARSATACSTRSRCWTTLGTWCGLSLEARADRLARFFDRAGEGATERCRTVDELHSLGVAAFVGERLRKVVEHDHRVGRDLGSTAQHRFGFAQLAQRMVRVGEPDGRVHILGPALEKRLVRRARGARVWTLERYDR